MVYDGPYRIKREVRRNAYVVEDLKGNVVGTYNSRQLRPNREAKLKPIVKINAIRLARQAGLIAECRMRKGHEINNPTANPRRNPTEEVQLRRGGGAMTGAPLKNLKTKEKDTKNREQNKEKKRKRKMKRYIS